jgi:predicted NUDIX family phosphoesterase
LIRQGDKFFVYQRGGSNNSQYKETRLQSKVSIGIGGHIEPFDNGLIDSLYREFDEEVILKKNNQIIDLRDEKGGINKELFSQLAEIKILGLIKDESDEVGKVHTGLITEINLLSPDLSIEIRDHEENVKGQMMNFKEYQTWIDQGEVIPEEWTKIVVGDFLS